MKNTKRAAWFAVGALALLSAMGTDRIEAQVVRQLTDIKAGSTAVPSMDDTGTEVFVATSTDPAGSNASHAFQIVRYTASSGAASQLTSGTDGTYPGGRSVSVSDDDQWVAFLSRDNPTG